LVIVFLGGCRQGMYDQAKYEPLEGSPLFADGRASRPLVDGTIPQGGLERDDPRLAAKEGGRLKETFPMPVDAALLARGRERFDIYCGVCHGPTGAGDGMIVQRGFPSPPSFHDDRLRAAPPGHIVDVITNGYGTMYPYADRVSPEDRWAIAAYVRALQRSRNGTIAEVPAAERPALEAER
jgi:mono/diheme cytochrome c family protein